MIVLPMRLMAQIVRQMAKQQQLKKNLLALMRLHVPVNLQLLLRLQPHSLNPPQQTFCWQRQLTWLGMLRLLLMCCPLLQTRLQVSQRAVVVQTCPQHPHVPVEAPMQILLRGAPSVLRGLQQPSVPRMEVGKQLAHTTSFPMSQVVKRP